MSMLVGLLHVEIYSFSALFMALCNSINWAVGVMGDRCLPTEACSTLLCQKRSYVN